MKFKSILFLSNDSNLLKIAGSEGSEQLDNGWGSFIQNYGQFRK